MNYDTKIKCLGCGTMLTMVFVSELVHCPKCDHVSLIHPPEQSFVQEDRGNTTISISNPSASVFSLVNHNG
ncbi:MAG: hypothetical protein UU13_C0001G0032 [Candidatus Nomurabacteria bacterium GW2011_GWB1_40_7]|uniref:Uncharacterized protein n=1 Tax=Candidatus Nomurabacteria bacterium GW2011_GWB1_40_7 TaxID=1618744 RepID=A0A0G0T1A8_9BACT|nr:MAG: hypothetical protein UU13_C0001G0032 [Candidatus Nomurabacteria bacterium GW2011_GWB1_40_7]